jgi:hypothetical protein
VLVEVLVDGSQTDVFASLDVEIGLDEDEDLHLLDHAERQHRKDMLELEVVVRRSRLVVEIYENKPLVRSASIIAYLI